MFKNNDINLVKTELGDAEKILLTNINLRKYTVYGTFKSDVCSNRCKKIQLSKLFQKCSCK